MLTVHDENGFLIANFSDFFALVDYFLLTAYSPLDFNLTISPTTVTVNDTVYTITYNPVENNRSDLQ